MTYVITEGSTPTISLSVSAIDAISGSTVNGQTLTAGALTPSGATVTYQWQSSATSDGTYTNISGATSSTYTLVFADVGKYLKVVATGSDSYTGSATSVASSIVTDTNWLTIGSQTWAKYNLNVGTRINGSGTQANNAILEKYCYADNESNCTTYGGLYQWGEAMQYATTEGAQGICPVESHVPSDAEWKTLEMQLGMDQTTADATGWRGTDQGTKLKSGGSSGMEVLLAGSRSNDTTFSGLGNNSFLATSTQSSTNEWVRYVLSSNTAVDRYATSKLNGFSVRCLKN